MLVYPGLNQEERIGNRWVKEKEVSRHVINRRADKKLDYVMNLYALVIGDRLTGKKSELLRKRLNFEGFRYITNLDLNYSSENRLWAFSYNLNYKTTFESKDPGVWGRSELPEIRFKVKTTGRLGIDHACWYDDGSKCSREEIDYFLNMLNNKLILDRIVLLDMTNIQLYYAPNRHQWTIINMDFDSAGDEPDQSKAGRVCKNAGVF